MVVTVPAPGAESGLFPPVGVPNVWDLSMEHNETFVRIRLGAAAEGDEAAELLLWPAARPNGQAVVACPGGGFNQVALEREGYPFARWFNERGVTYAVLCYRMPRGRAGVPAEDIRCALALMRERAAEWGITRLGVMGASIGGHVASTAATLFDGEERPDFQVLLYPVISMLDAWAHRPSRGRLMGENPSAELCERLSLELHVTPQTAPAFIVLAEDDALAALLRGVVHPRRAGAAARLPARRPQLRLRRRLLLQGALARRAGAVPRGGVTSGGGGPLRTASTPKKPRFPVEGGGAFSFCGLCGISRPCGSMPAGCGPGVRLRPSGGRPKSDSGWGRGAPGRIPGAGRLPGGGGYSSRRGSVRLLWPE